MTRQVGDKIFLITYNRGEGMNELKKDFRDLKARVRALRELSSIENTSGIDDNIYYQQEDILKEHLKAFLCRDLKELSSRQLIEFLSWCSSYRPKEPWQILVGISMYNDSLTKDVEA